MVAEKLTQKKVERLRIEGRHGDGRGLYLQVTPATEGAVFKSWIFRYRLHGRERWMGLGRVDDVALDDAREQASRARRLLLDGKDPIEDRDNRRSQERQAEALAKARSKPFEAAAREWYDAHGGKGRNAKYNAQFIASLQNYAFGKIGRIAVADLETKHVRQVLTPIWDTIPETASRVRRRIELVLDWATASGFREGDNPARWTGHLKALMPKQDRKVKHHAALPYADLPAFMVTLRDRPGFTSRALELLILTAARTSEITGARWQEIDLDHKVWTIPPDRMKAGKPHRVPLSDAAVALLQAMPREGDFVFPGARRGKPLSPMALDMTLQRMGHKGTATVHGFRSSFRDWAADHHYPDDIAEMALAHSKGSQTVAAYLRSDLLERRVPLMADWAAYCSGTPVKKSANVTPLRARA